MYQPELHLGRVSETVRNVLVAAVGLDMTERDQAVVDKLRHVARQVVTSQVLYDLRAIAVTGMQGVGKTSFVKRLYDLPDDLLPQDVGRDEKAPVLIREHSGPLKVTATYLVSEDRSRSMDERPVAHGQLKQLLRDPPNDLALVTLYVPYRVFNESSQALVLLPGLESSLGDSAPRDPWDALVRHAVLSSAACIFVTSPKKLADGEAHHNMQRLRERFSGLRPLVVVTHADVTPPSQMEEFLATARTQIGASSESAAIAVGDTAELASAWRPKIIARLAEFSGTSAALRVHQLDQSRALAERSLANALSELDDIAVKTFGKLATEEYRQVDQVIEKFERSAGKTRRHFQKYLATALDARNREVGDSATETIIDAGLLDKLVRNFWGEDLKDVVEWERKLQRLWMGEGQTSAVVSQSMGDTARKEFEPMMNAEVVEPVPAKTAEGALVVGDRPLLTPDELADARWLLGPVDSEGRMPSKSITAVTQLLPALALTFASHGEGLSRLQDVGQGTALGAPASGVSRAKVEEILGDVRTADEMRRRTIATFAAVALGADASDGKIDSIPAIAKALGIKMTPLASGMLAGGVAVIAIGAIVMSVRRQLIRQDFAQRDRALILIRACRDATEAQVLDAYDTMMDRLSEQVRRRLNSAHHVDVKQGRVQVLKMAIAQAQEARAQFAESLERGAALAV